MRNITAVVDHYMAVWNEPDAARRRQRIQDLWPADGTTCHSALDARGYEAIEARVHIAHEEWVRDGGYVFKARPNVVGHHHVAKFKWEMVPARGGTSRQ